MRFALCDCNNFFVSCERPLRPDLKCLPKRVPVEDVWGIGRRCAKALIRFGIRSARAFRDREDDLLRRHWRGWKNNGKDSSVLQAFFP